MHGVPILGGINYIDDNGPHLASSQYIVVSILQISKVLNNGLFKVTLEFSFSIPGMFQAWNSNKSGFEKLNSRSKKKLGIEKLNSRFTEIHFI